MFSLAFLTFSRNYGRRVVPNRLSERISWNDNCDRSSGTSKQQLLHYMEEKIDALDDVGLPKPVSLLEIGEIMDEFHDAYNDLFCVCCVCDPICARSETKEWSPGQLNPTFFTPLMAPVEDCGVPPLHGDLIRQYDVSQFFNDNIVLSLCNILLSPRGLIHHRQEDGCESHLMIFCRDFL